MRPGPPHLFRTVLNHIARRSNPSRERSQHRARRQEVSVGRERELVSRLFRAVQVVPASGVTSLRTSPERIVDDGLDCPCTPAALGTAAQAVVDVFGMPQRIVRGSDGVADIVVAEDVTRANNHENAEDLQ